MQAEQDSSSGTQQLASGTGTLVKWKRTGQGAESIHLPKEPKNCQTEQREFNDEGIKKIDEVVNDDLQDVLDRLDALRSDENAYTSFTQENLTRWMEM